MTRIALEIAVDGPSGARTAFEGGADRVELCQALAATGGLTPSGATVDAVLAVAGDPERVAVLVRPRVGGFVYSAEEIDLVAADVSDVVRRGAGAVVVGALTADGAVDLRALERWRDAAGAAELVFHRAIDTVPEPAALVGDLLESGVSRVLTSGGAVRSIDGVDALRALVAASAGRLEIMAGGGVRVEDIPALTTCGVDAIHLSARHPSGDSAPSGPGGGSTGYDVTDGDIVRRADAAVRRRS
ncbi:copper homeostasis protein CutC [Microbacterium sp. MYb64]|uniref:copper homeostasis protein CutC n=1 Tax=Microbacterium sp. MYb64 TaxID=1848691 RepID=UPI000CFAB960|nr:copper homeostasis protein CutC [Microbacterium sp. MYb64]PRB08514.1 copper homeostasis protein CutC [Microbacterium sp. MYb64]